MHILLYFIFYSLYLIFYSFYFMYTSLVLYFSIFALSKERTRLTFHCWLYNLCIVVYVTNKTWNLKLKGGHCRQKQCFFMHLSSVRFWAFWFFIKCFFRLVERKHLKDTVKCFFYSTSSICVNRFKLQYIFVKAVFLLKISFLSEP